MFDLGGKKKKKVVVSFSYANTFFPPNYLVREPFAFHISNCILLAAFCLSCHTCLHFFFC